MPGCRGLREGALVARRGVAEAALEGHKPPAAGRKREAALESHRTTTSDV